MIEPRRVAAEPDRGPFDAVLFDLDGTLVGSHGVWLAQAREAAREVLAEVGRAASTPSPERFAAAFGQPAREVAAHALAGEPPAVRAAFANRFDELRASAGGVRGVSPMPGAFALLEDLRQGGAKLAIATNAGRGFLALAMDGPEAGGLGFGAAIDAGRCLDSPGVRDKSDMLADLLQLFGTHSAVMVGDSFGDARAAAACGIGFVHFTGSGAPPIGGVDVEARCAGLGELADLLARRDRALGRMAAELGASPAGSRGPRCLGLFGPPGSGARLLGRDLARALARLDGSSGVWHADLDEAVGGAGAPVDVESAPRALAGARAAAVAEGAGAQDWLVCSGLGLAAAAARRELDLAVEVRADSGLRARRVLAAEPSPRRARALLSALEAAWTRARAGAPPAGRVLEGGRLLDPLPDPPGR